MQLKNGCFVISLDFELFWGVRDCINLTQYQENILGVRKTIPLLLEIFSKYNIHATWAVVGFLFAKNKKELCHFSPDKKPSYSDTNLCPYLYLKEKIGEDESVDHLHYGGSLIQKIASYQYQEIASHTFSHYYTLAEGQTPDEFRQDIKSAIDIAKIYNFNLRTIIFPRNQYNLSCLSIFD